MKSNLNMHRAHSGSFRVRIEARHEWVGPKRFRKADLRMDQRIFCDRQRWRNGAMRIRRIHRVPGKMACGSKESYPPFPFPPGASRGGNGSPHAAHAARQPKPLARIDAAAPPARGVSNRSAETPLARSPLGAQPSDDHRSQKEIRKGRHVGLDFFDLLIEDDKI